jgi:ribonuclease HI
LGAKRITMHGDSKLFINQVKGIYQSKHPRMRAYKNLVLELLKEFSELFDNTGIPTEDEHLQ